MQELTPLARDLGECALADASMERLRWSQIGYRSEERSFGEATRWVRELCRLEPESWTNEGWKLWSVADASEQQFCSVNASAEMEESFVAAAIRCGPRDLWRLLAATLPKVTDRKWHYETRNRLGTGFGLALREGLSLSIQERLTIWCLFVAFCRWFDGGDIVTLAELRSDLLAHCRDDEERKILLSELERLTPGEAKRIPKEERSRAPKPLQLEDEPGDYSADATIAAVEAGTKLQLSEVARAIRHVTRIGHGRRDELIPRMLASVGSDDDYATSWSWADRFPDSALATIAAQVTDEQLWSLVSAISFSRGDTRSWLAGTAENLHRLAYARAATRGTADLRAGFTTHLNMHIAWAFGGSRWQPPWPVLPTIEEVATWDDVVLRMLSVIFRSRSAEVLSSAIAAMHALVDLRPENIVPLFRTLLDEWAQRWLLNSAEAWAVLHSDALEDARLDLDQMMHKAQLEMRLQSWIVLSKLADIKGRQRPIFPMPSTGISDSNQIRSSSGGILETAPTERGFMRSIDRHASAKGKLDRLRACGLNFSSLEGEIADRLLRHTSEGNPFAALKSEAHRDNDFLCGGLDTENAVGEVIENAISSDWFSEGVLPRLAQGLFDNEDPWMLRQTPLPSPKPDEWPTKELGAFTRGVDAGEILEQFRSVAGNQDLPTGWRVVAAYVYGAHWQEDFALFQWMEQLPRDPDILLPSRRPTIPSGRTFNWWLGDHFEPSPPNDLPVLTFFTGGAQRLIYASVEIQPSKLWRGFGWEPGRLNPLEWNRNRDCVARYQRFHGAPNTSGHGPHHRHPILHRWIVRADALDEAMRGTEQTFRMREDFERKKGDFEG